MCNERTETWLRSLSSRLAAPTGRFREKVLAEIAMRLKKREGSKRMREEGSGGRALCEPLLYGRTAAYG